MTIEKNQLEDSPPLLRPGVNRLEELYARAQFRLVIQVAALTGDVQVAEDLVQEAFRRCVEKWGQVSRYDDPEAWVRSVAFNLARSRWRRLATRTNVLSRRRRTEPTTGPDAENVGVMIAVSRLNKDERDVIVLHYLLDHPVSAVAAQLRIPEGTVKSRLARAPLRLAELLSIVDGEENNGD